MVKSFKVYKGFKKREWLIQENKKSWEQRVVYDIESSYYNVDQFLRGKNSLFSKEIEELGDVKDKRILHIQSYFGLDSLSFCRMGAKEVVGIDFCNKAVKKANELAKQTNLNASFFEIDLTQSSLIPELGKFDIVYCSYGALCWIPEIELLVKKANQLLKEGGFFYLIDFHPMAYTLGLHQDKLISFPFDNSVPLVTSWKGTYASPSAPIESEEYNWNHSVSEIINAFAKNSYTISFFNEHPFLPMEAFYNLAEKDDGLYYSKFNNEFMKVPLCLSLKALKNGI